MRRFEGKVAMVTGGSRGIGAAIAQRLSDEGARVLTVQRGEDPQHEWVQADLTEAAAAAAAVAEVVARAGRLDVLINNAGLMRESTLDDLSLAQWQQQLTLNLSAPFLCIQAALSQLRLHRGAVVNIGSIEGLAANPGHAAYCAAKAGLHGLTRAVAVDLGADGVRCNAVAPGWIDTDLNRDFIDKQPDPQRFRREIGAIHPLGRIGHAAEVAALVAFLAAEESGFITGQVMTVDGGRSAKLSLP